MVSTGATGIGRKKGPILMQSKQATHCDVIQGSGRPLAPSKLPASSIAGTTVITRRKIDAKS